MAAEGNDFGVPATIFGLKCNLDSAPCVQNMRQVQGI